MPVVSSAFGLKEVTVMVLMTNLNSQEPNTDPVEPYLRPPKSKHSR